MLGTGTLEEKIKKMVANKKLEDVVKIVGSVPSDKVKDYMKKANIFIFTSKRQEGWGVVMNEAMNTGCSIVANKKIGSVPFLIKHNENGMIYDSYQELEKYVKELINNKDLRIKLSKNAYKFITEKWTSQVAVDNLLKLFESIINKNEIEIKDGPASKAQ